MFCPECGKHVAGEPNFCPHCGKKLKSSAEDAEPREEPVPADVPEEDAARGDVPPAAQETAREAAAEDVAAGEAQLGPAGHTQPPAASESAPPPPPRPVPSSRADASDEEPESGSAPPTAPPPREPGPPQAPAGEEPGTPKKSGATTCIIIGCVVLLVLGIGAAVVFGILGTRLVREADEQVRNLPTNSLDIGEIEKQIPGGSGHDDGAQGVEGIGEIIGQLGEAASDFGEKLSGLEVSDLDTAAVPDGALDPIYGFLAGMAFDSVNTMELFASPDLKAEVGDTWEAAEPGEHLGFRVVEQEELGADKYRIVVAQTVRAEDGAETERGWELTVGQIDNEWKIDGFSETEL